MEAERMEKRARCIVEARTCANKKERVAASVDGGGVHVVEDHGASQPRQYLDSTQGAEDAAL